MMTYLIHMDDSLIGGKESPTPESGKPIPTGPDRDLSLPAGRAGGGGRI